MTRVALKDELLDAQLLRAVGASPYGGSDVGECLAAARASGAPIWTAGTASGLGPPSGSPRSRSRRRRGHPETARLAYLRASSYFRTAGVMLMGAPLDPRLVEAYARQTDMFRRAAALMVPAAEIVEIPFEDTTLPGYFLRPAGARRPRATVVLTGGYDGTAEELYLANGAAALARGYNVLAFDGPGQGAALIERGLVMRAGLGERHHSGARLRARTTRCRPLPGCTDRLESRRASRAARSERRASPRRVHRRLRRLRPLRRVPRAAARPVGRPFASGRPWAQERRLPSSCGSSQASQRRGGRCAAGSSSTEWTTRSTSSTRCANSRSPAAPPNITCPTWSVTPRVTTSARRHRNSSTR